MNVLRKASTRSASYCSKRTYARIYKAGKRPVDDIPTSKKWLSFDIETAAFVHTEFQANTNYKSFPSPGIACVATLSSDGDSKLFYSGQDGGIGGKLSTQICEEVVSHLEKAVQEGYTIVTWNGLGFDFPILALEAEHLERTLQHLALSHVDIMFQIFCVKGFPLSMEATAKGMGLKAKSIMKSDDVPTMWGNGNRQEVLDYVRDDAKVTLELAEKIDRRKEVSWMSKAGKPAALSIPELKPVKDCIELPLPDVSWMKSALPREAYHGWTINTPAN